MRLIILMRNNVLINASILLTCNPPLPI